MVVATLPSLQAQNGPRGALDGRVGFASAVDPGGRGFVFGGYDGTLLDDFWEGHLGSWIQHSGPGPSPRAFASMAYDPVRGRLVLFGGFDGGFLGDTWEWDGQAWTRVSIRGPAPRAVATMGFDTIHRRIVVHGGYDGTIRQDSWHWDGLRWAQIGTSNGEFSLSDERAPHWNPGVEGGIPDTSGWPVVVATDPPHNAVGDGQTDNARALQSAIDAAQSLGRPAVVYIPAGTYWWTRNRMVIPSNVVIRGEGQGQTKLIYHLTSDGAYPMFTTDGRAGAKISIVEGVERGSRRIQIASAQGWQAGQWLLIQLDQNPPYVDNPFNRNRRYVTQIVQIAGVSGDQIELRTPLYLDFEKRYQPKARLLQVTENVGFENMSLGYTDDSVDKWHAAIFFHYAVNSWVYDCEIGRGGRFSVEFGYAARNEMRRCWAHDYLAATGRQGSQYSIVFREGAHDNLIVDSVVTGFPIPVILQNGASGNVVAYNFLPQHSNPANNHGILFHGAYPSSNLVEGNDIEGNITLDNFWGQQGPYNTIFRNRVRGSGDNPWTEAFGIRTHQTPNSIISSYTNILGNITYQMSKVPFCTVIQNCHDVDQFSEHMWLRSNVVRHVFQLVTPEPTTILEDIHIGDVAPPEWVGSLPASLYLAAPPYWWPEDKPWPAIGADVDDFRPGRTRVKLPAQERFENRR